MTRRNRLDDIWLRVDRSGDCWEWTGALSGGYGSVSYHGRVRHAHRVVWELLYGPVDSGLHVCHTCDNPRCVRPAHLFVGTAKDNAADREAKGRGRHATGTRNAKSKLTPELVAELRSLRGSGATYVDLARRYGISAPSARDVGIGKTWQI